MNISNKTLRRASLVAAAVFVLLCVAAAHVMYRISQNRDGVCVSEGRVLSDEELRRKVIESVVKNKIDSVQAHNSPELTLGIAPEMSEVSLVTIIDNAYNNEKSFEENFSVVIASPQTNGNRFDVSSLKEPFMLVEYSYDTAQLYPMSSVQRELIDVREIDYHFGLADIYAGYGKKFYKMSVAFLPGQCCFKHSERLSREEYNSRKMMHYQRWLNNGRNITKHQMLMAVSNCGDVLLTPDDNYRVFGTYRIKHVRRK